MCRNMKWVMAMPAFNFQPTFADLVESGQKTQTIRKTLCGKVGDPVYLYTGQRTKQCRKLGEGVVVDVAPVEIVSRPVIRVLMSSLDVLYMDSFARNDGFANAGEMFNWFSKQYGLPFEGWLYRWRLNK